MNVDIKKSCKGLSLLKNLQHIQGEHD